jgi:hypothetical protein
MIPLPSILLTDYINGVLTMESQALLLPGKTLTNIIRCLLMKYTFVFTEEFLHPYVLGSRSAYLPQISKESHLQ